MNPQNELKKGMRDLGWKLQRTKNHWVWYCSCGEHVVTTAQSPGDSRSVKNALSRARRECKA